MALSTMIFLASCWISVRSSVLNLLFGELQDPDLVLLRQDLQLDLLEVVSHHHLGVHDQQRLLRRRNQVEELLGLLEVVDLAEEALHHDDLEHPFHLLHDRLMGDQCGSVRAGRLLPQIEESDACCQSDQEHDEFGH
jgi:hypothetical protein